MSRSTGRLRSLLQPAHLARLAYTGQDGLPRVVPVGFLWSDERIVICTAATAPKLRALSSRPELAELVRQVA